MGARQDFKASCGEEWGRPRFGKIAARNRCGEDLSGRLRLVRLLDGRDHTRDMAGQDGRNARGKLTERRADIMRAVSWIAGTLFLCSIRLMRDTETIERIDSSTRHRSLHKAAEQPLRQQQNPDQRRKGASRQSIVQDEPQGFHSGSLPQTMPPVTATHSQ